jgi:hypothetical protein
MVTRIQHSHHILAVYRGLVVGNEFVLACRNGITTNAGPEDNFVFSRVAAHLKDGIMSLLVVLAGHTSLTHVLARLG